MPSDPSPCPGGISTMGRSLERRHLQAQKPDAWERSYFWLRILHIDSPTVCLPTA